MRQKCYQEIHMEGGSGRQDLAEEMLSTVCLEASTNPKESLGAGMTLQSCLRSECWAFASSSLDPAVSF